MPSQKWLQGMSRYLVALLFVGCAFGIRIALDPLFGGTRLAFSIFYLAVVLAAFFCGTRPAIATAVVSAIVAYWAFIAPAFTFKINVDALVGMGFFSLTSAVDIYFITGMTRALENYRREHHRAEALAEGNAMLFREFSERTTDHLQLVAALLQSRADGGVDALYRHALTEASQRTMAISRAHRALGERAERPVDFTGFARQLMRASMDTAGLPGREVDISGDAISLPAERATSIAVVLLEWTRAVLRAHHRESEAPIRLHVGCDALSYRLRLATVLPESARDRMPPMDEMSRRLVEAAIDQIQGRCSYYRDAADGVFELEMPIEPLPLANPPMAMIDPPSGLLH